MGVVCIVLDVVGVVNSRYIFLWAWFTIDGRRYIFQVTPHPKTRNCKKAVSLDYFCCFTYSIYIFFNTTFYGCYKINYTLSSTSHIPRFRCLSAPCTIYSSTLFTITLQIFKINKAAQNKHFDIVRMCLMYYSLSRAALDHYFNN